jgi:hypothetical protein
MKRIGLLKAICYICIAGGLACRLFIRDNTLGSTLAIVLLALSVILLAFGMHRSRKQ